MYRLRLIFAAFCFLSLLLAEAQITREDYYNTIDNAVFSYSKQNEYAAFDSVATFINTKYISRDDRLRAYYTWIAMNIRYDTDHMSDLQLISSFNVQNVYSSGQKPEEVFKSRKAVCEGYSNLLSAFCKTSGIPCYTVCGHVKTEEGEIPKIMHAWNVVKPDTVWKLIDVTWSSGYVNQGGVYVKRFSNNYFAPKAEVFIKDHLPLDPMWQLLYYPYNREHFEKSTAPSPNTEKFHFNDSIHFFMKHTESQQQGLSFLHYYRNNPGEAFYAKHLDVYHNNQIADLFVICGVYQTDFLHIAENKLSKKPTLTDWKKAKAHLDSVEVYLKKSELMLNAYTPKTPEYVEQFSLMRQSVAENRKNVKYNQTYLKQIRPFIVKK